MIYLLIFFMLISGYYTLSYGVTLYVEDENILGGSSVIVVAILGTLLPIVVLLFRQ